jgi:acetolactate synthase-1/2/3 large subunit
MTVAQIVARYLSDAGVRYAFGVSGHSLFAITDALYLQSGIDFVPAQIELSSSYTATAYARATRGPSVCLVSAGAGATNAVTGIAQAFKESTPVICISSEVDTRVAGHGASSWHEVPQEALFRPITRLSATLRSPSAVLSLLDEGFAAATATGRAGPVYLAIPRDLQVEEVEVAAPPWPLPQAVPAPRAEGRLLDEAARELAQARAPVIIAGGGVHWANASAELRELAELLQAPVGTTPSHKALISEEHPLSLGVLGFGSFPFANKLCRESDLVLAVGTTFSEGLTLGYGDRVIPPHARIVQIDLDSEQLGRWYPVAVGIHADAGAALRALVERLRSAPRPAERMDRVEQLQSEKDAWRAELAKRGSVADGPITQWHVYHAVKQVVDPSAVLVSEGGTTEFTRRLLVEGDAYTGGDFRAIGHGLASCVGLAYAHPGRRVVSVSGDGAFMMELQELATLVRDRLPVSVVVVQNDAYGNMKRDQVHSYDGRVIGTELLVPDLPTLGRAFGLYSERVERPADLIQALRAAVATDGPSLLDVVCPIEGI